MRESTHSVITDAALRVAAEEVAMAMLDDVSAEPHTFSQRFEKKMKRLLRRARHPVYLPQGFPVQDRLRRVPFQLDELVTVTYDHEVEEYRVRNVLRDDYVPVPEGELRTDAPQGLGVLAYGEGYPSVTASSFVQETHLELLGTIPDILCDGTLRRTGGPIRR